RELLERLFDSFEELEELRKEEAQRIQTMSKIENHQYNELTEKAVKEAGYTAHRYLIREVDHHVKRINNQPKIEVYGDLPDSVLEGLNDQIPEGDNELDPDIRIKLAKRIVNRIDEVTPLSEVESLRDALNEDLDKINEKGAMGIESTSEVLAGIWEIQTENQGDGGKMSDLTSSNIGEYINFEESPVSAVLNRVSDDGDYETWTSSNIVHKITNSRRGNRWELTSYGRLLCYIHFDCEEDTAWMYHYALGPEELSMRERKMIIDALEEIGYIN
ncbi:MAG: hypothetical protein ABEI86_12545, partial [Halobacteriaceae archaeon]